MLLLKKFLIYTVIFSELNIYFFNPRSPCHMSDVLSTTAITYMSDVLSTTAITYMSDVLVSTTAITTTTT